MIPYQIKRDAKHHFQLILTLWVLLSLAGCATQPTSSDGDKKPVETLTSVEQHVFDLLQKISATSPQKHQMSEVSHCRYEISTLWSNLEKGYYGAHNKQRFSFTHDIRNISHNPSYILFFADNMEHWEETIELSFNRPLPTTFRHVSTSDYQQKIDHTTSDSFSLDGFKTTDVKLMQQLQTGLTKMALFCGNDVSKMNQIKHKVIGRWELFGLSEPLGTLTIDSQKATLILDLDDTISGPYIIENEGSHYSMTINPQSSATRYRVLLDFVTNNYARLLLLKDQQGPVPFERLTAQDEPNPAEIKLFWLGDLR